MDLLRKSQEALAAGLFARHARIVSQNPKQQALGPCWPSFRAKLPGLAPLFGPPHPQGSLVSSLPLVPPCPGGPEP